MHRRWSLPGIVAIALTMLVAGAAAYFGLDYWSRTVRGFRRVEEVGIIVKELGGSFAQGVVNCDFYIRLYGTPITDQQLRELARKLKEFPPPYLDQNHHILVDLSGTAVTDQGVAFLAGVRRLAWLYLNDTLVTDAGIEALADLDLEAIELRNTSVTDKIVPVLASMRRLYQVDLENTAVSEKGQRELADALPNGSNVIR